MVRPYASEPTLAEKALARLEQPELCRVLTLSIVAAVPERQPREAEMPALRFTRLSIITYG